MKGGAIRPAQSEGRARFGGDTPMLGVLQGVDYHNADQLPHSVTRLLLPEIELAHRKAERVLDRNGKPKLFAGILPAHIKETRGGARADGRAAHRHGRKNCRRSVESGFYLWQRQSVSRLRACRAFESVSAMIASAPLELPAHDKLDVLRYLDEFHFWNSLDDERRCQRCGHTITGRQILVFELHGTRGAMRLQCPTPGCVSKPGDWMYANPVKAARLRAEAEATDPGTHGRIHGGEHRKKIQATRSAGSHRVRDAIAHFAFLRPFATKFHAIRPVA